MRARGCCGSSRTATSAARAPSMVQLRVEDLVAAVLGVGLREHHQFGIGRIAAQAREGLAAGSRSHRPRAPVPAARLAASSACAAAVRAQSCAAAAGDGARTAARPAGASAHHHFGHAIEQQPRPPRVSALGARAACDTLQLVADAALDAPHGRRGRTPGRCRWPCSTRARWCPRAAPPAAPGCRPRSCAGAARPDRRSAGCSAAPAARRVSGRASVDEMDEPRAQGLNPRLEGLQAGQQLGDTEGRKGGPALKLKHQRGSLLARRRLTRRSRIDRHRERGDIAHPPGR